MGGTAGKLASHPGPPIEPALIRRMTAVLRHRGPDDEGIWVDGSVGLGNRRLAIIDLSPRARQPMSNEDGTTCLDERARGRGDAGAERLARAGS